MACKRLEHGRDGRSDDPCNLNLPPVSLICGFVMLYMAATSVP